MISSAASAQRASGAVRMVTRRGWCYGWERWE